MFIFSLLIVYYYSKMGIFFSKFLNFADYLARLISLPHYQYYSFAEVGHRFLCLSLEVFYFYIPVDQKMNCSMIMRFIVAYFWFLLSQEEQIIFTQDSFRKNLF